MELLQVCIVACPLHSKIQVSISLGRPLQLVCSNISGYYLIDVGIIRSIRNRDHVILRMDLRGHLWWGRTLLTST